MDSDKEEGKTKQNESSQQVKTREHLVKIANDTEKYLLQYKGRDPLRKWIQYLEWLEEKMPTERHRIISTLKKCTLRLQRCPDYFNDVRYIRLWIQYADMVSNPNDIFKYLYKNEIGKQVSLFYVGWAWVLESIGKYSYAHKVYLKAIKKQAQPQDFLQQKYADFQRRMEGRWISLSGSKKHSSAVNFCTESSNEWNAHAGGEKTAVEPREHYVRKDDGCVLNSKLVEMDTLSDRARVGNGRNATALVTDSTTERSKSIADAKALCRARLNAQRSQRQRSDKQDGIQEKPSVCTITCEARSSFEEQRAKDRAKKISAKAEDCVSPSLTKKQKVRAFGTTPTLAISTKKASQLSNDTQKNKVDTRISTNHSLQHNSSSVMSRHKAVARKYTESSVATSEDKKENVNRDAECTQMSSRNSRKALTTRDDIILKLNQPVKKTDTTTRAVRTATKPFGDQNGKENAIQAKGETRQRDCSKTDDQNPDCLDPYQRSHRQSIVENESVIRFLLDECENVHVHSEKMPLLPAGDIKQKRSKIAATIKISDAIIAEVTSLLGSGSFARVYSVTTKLNGVSQALALKYEKKTKYLPWEYFIVNQARVRLASLGIQLGNLRALVHFTRIDIFSNGSLLLMEKSVVGTLHSLLGRYRRAGKSFPEILTMYYSIQMFKIVEMLHRVDILHGDIKPDNWVFYSGRCSVGSSILQPDDPVHATGNIVLIDFGRAIDLKNYPKDTAFSGDCHVKGFQCVEMLTGKPWRHQIDTFGLCSTIHCMLFGSYMQVYQVKEESSTRWKIGKSFKRYWQIAIWGEIFGTLLNVSSCEKQPCLADLRNRLETVLLSTPNHQQVLHPPSVIVNDLNDIPEQAHRFAGSNLFEPINYQVKVWRVINATHMENEILDQFLETIINHPTNTAAVESYKDHILENLTQNLLSSELLGNKIVDAIFRCHNRQSVKHLRELLIDVITRVDGVTDTLASVFISRFNEIAHSFASCRSVALDLSCELLKVCKMDQTSLASWQLDFLKGQAIVLESTSDDKARQQMRCRQKITNLLHSRPALVPSYLTVIEMAKNDDQFYVLLRAIVSMQKNFDTETQRKLLESYVYWSFESKTQRFPARISQNDLKLEWITKEQFDTIISPVMEKLLKKSPDAILEATLACVCACSLDFSPYLESVFLPLLTTKLRSQNNIVRSLCVELAAALLSTSNSEDSRFLLVSEICRLLEGKYGLLAHFYQREAVYLALLNTITVYKGGNYSKESVVVTCDTLIPIVLQAVEKEAHKATRYLGLETLGELSALGQQIPDALVSYMKKGMKDVKAEMQVLGCVYVLLVVLAGMKNHSTQDTNLIKTLTSFSKDLDRIACDGNLKSKSSCNRLSAIATMGAIATKSASADAEIVQTQSWKLLSDPNSFIAPSIRHVLTRLNSREPSEDAKLEAQSLQQSAVAISHFLACDQQLHHHLYALLVDLLCCKDISVRLRTESCIISMYDRGQTKHAIGLMKGLVRKVTGVDPSASRSISSIWRHALRVIVPKVENEMAEDTRAELFAPVLFVSHHPILMSGKSLKHYGKEWEHICKRFVCSSGDLPAEDFEGIRDEIDRIIENGTGVQESILNMLVKNSSERVSEYENFLFSGNERDRLSAQRVIVTLLQFGGSGEGEDIALRLVLQDLILRQIDWERISQITEEDAAIYSNPFDQLYVAPKDQDQSRGVGSSRRKASRQGNEDEQWEQQVRDELERKKRETQTTTSYTAEEKLQLDAQQKIRVHLKSLETRISYLSEIIQFVAKSAPEEFHPAIPYVFQKVVTLFESKLYSKYAHEITFALAKSISPILLRAHAEDIANSIRLVLRHGNASSSHSASDSSIETNGPIFRALTALMDYCFGVRFSSEDDFDADSPLNYVPPPSFHLIFPILRTLLHTNNSLRHWTLPIFAIHARMIPEEEEEDVGDALAQRLLRKEMIELAINLLFHIAVKKANISNDDLHPAKILSNICTTPTLTPEEWKPILGDHGLLSEHSVVREACLYAILQMMQAEESVLAIQSDPMLTCRLFMTRFDPSDVCQGIANRIWNDSHLEQSDQFGDYILQLLSHSQECVRESAASAIAEGIRLYPNSANCIFDSLKAQYVKYLPHRFNGSENGGIRDVRAQLESELIEDPASFLPRCGVGSCIEKAFQRSSFSRASIDDMMTFIIETGLMDPNDKVRAQIRKAGIQIVDTCGGGSNTMPLMTIFDEILERKPTKQGKDLIASDFQREGVVVFLGAIAKHLEKTDPRVSSIVDSLLDALSIPSESVQRSVANCLSSLIPAVKDRSTAILDSLLLRATEGQSFGERKGAAFGVSATVKGLGISSLKQHEIIPRLEEAMKKGGANARQGAMFVFECLGERLGMLFEPYIVVIVPIMLKCFADASLQVREASSHTSKVIMAKLSAHGVRLVLPTLLVSLDDNAWRTKQASIFILGSMAHCAPRQLGSCLPQVVPKLMQALTDSHPKVCEAGKLALKDIGSVVQNPEITSILKVLLNALEDPNKYATAALQQLQSMTFKHSIDAPSLALVMPIITRGLKDRTGDAKKKSALIVGSMCRMINDAKDLLPYMEMVLPNLKTLLMDPIPEIRTVSAKAMGKLVTGLGESHFIGILSWLMESLQGDFGSVERSGAAQGLCEVLVALGGERVEKTLFDEIFPIARHPKASVREGVLWIIAFLPPILGKSFAMFLHDALPIIVTGLSDEVDAVRDVAAHAGHVVVSTHAVSHAKEILPALVNGLFDDNRRIRQSSVALLGDLIHRIGGVRAGILPASSTANDDEATMGGAAGDKAIIKLLGVSQRNSILASLYMIRSDASVSVRQNALQVWKSVVTNTPKVLRQILETLMNVIVKALSGENVEKQTMAGRTLGEIVRKLGENVLPEIVPFLRSGLSGNQSSGMRHGACIGLAEIIDCSSKKQLEDFVSTLVGAIVDGVSDELPQVRASAAQAFVGLHNNIGYRAIDETIPCLLKVIKQDAIDGKDSALLGLQDILRVKFKEVIPYLIPRLLVAPLSESALDSLAYTAKATGSVIHFQLERIFAVLFDQFVLESKRSSILDEKIRQTLEKVVLSVDASGVHWLIVEMCKHCEASDPQKRKLAFDLIREFCSATQTNYEDQIPLLLKQITVHLNDPVRDVVVASSGALSGLNVTVRPEVLMKSLNFIRHNINTVASDARHRKGGVGADGEFLLPGLCIPKGLDPFLPSYHYALMNGSPEERQSAAAGLGELVQISNSECLRPYLIKITGPLIRIAGDRFPGHVKASILETLGIMIRKGGIALKPFLPQLQTTFIKALNDPAAEVRAHGTSALLELVAMSPRLDALIIELSGRMKTTEGNVRQANMSALISIVEQVHSKLSLATKTSMQQCLMELLEGNDDTFRMQACNCLALSVGTDADEYLANSGKYLAPEQDPSCLSKERKQSIALFWSFLLEQNPPLSEPKTLAIATFLSSLGQEEHEAVRSSAIRAAASLIKIRNSFLGQLIPLLVSGITNTNKEDNKISLRTIKRVAKKSPSITRAHLTELVEPIFSKIKGCNIAVKISAERALLYVLEIPFRPETLSEYVQACGDPTSAKLIAEYARRVLAKLKLESDESE